MTTPPSSRRKLAASSLADRIYPRAAHEIHVEWRYLEDHIAREAEVGLDLDPDFQRAHVWTAAQQVAFCEHVLCGGETGLTLIVASTGRTHECSVRPDGSIFIPDYALLDGKQRLEAVRRFMRGEIRVFVGVEGEADGYAWDDLDVSLRRYHTTRFVWRTVLCATRADMLRLYLRFNAGGVVHAREELDRVAAMLRAETGGGCS